ncbi:cellulase family glycosylhydrolase [Alkalitalea saponilacus]|nr:cellulase family glycosylhydrolase [Alkalitalea saponilacus]ASB50110.1 DNA mismatch repair protein [Alkalitalea saponilacus]
MEKNIMKVFLVFLSVLIFAACKDDDEVFNLLEVDVSEIELDADKTTGVFTITTDADSWEITNPATEWLSLSRTSGTGSIAMIMVTVDGKTPEVRSAELVINAGNAPPVTVTVTQLDSEFVYELTSNRTSLTIRRLGGSQTFDINTSAPEWSLEIEGDWINVDRRTGTESSVTITVSADGNESGAERKGKITIRAEYAPQRVVEVSQLALYPSYNISPPEPDMTGVERTASELAQDILIGWNIGNSLEVPSGETGWGNARTTQALIDAVQAAGFNAIRIPCAWNSYADQNTAEIDPNWLARVKEVVDYCINNDMFVIINTHWDGGWLEENPFYSKQDEINLKFTAFWEQIATYFRDYDERLLFAGTNEVRADYGIPTTEHITVQQSFNQNFVTTVRSTGGRNAYRNLIVQTYNTNIDHGINFHVMPEDNVENRLFAEVHYYDPYQFALQDSGSGIYTVWGESFIAADSDWWGQEDHVDRQFAKVKSKFVDNDIPVILGEYGAIHRSALTGEDYEAHKASREYYLEYVTRSAIQHGLIPFYWDNGHRGNNGFALFYRSNGNIFDQGALDALMRGANE